MCPAFTQSFARQVLLPLPSQFNTQHIAVRDAETVAEADTMTGAALDAVTGAMSGTMSVATSVAMAGAASGAMRVAFRSCPTCDT